MTDPASPPPPAPRPGWYPDPSGGPGERYFDGTEWTDESQPATKLANREISGKGVLVIIAVVALLFIAMRSCGSHSDDAQNFDEASTSSRAPTTSSSVPSTTSRIAPPFASSTADAPAGDSYGSIPRDGTFQIGGVDGKKWGVYEADGGPNCQWSIRSIARYRPGEILDSGTTPRVNIQPDGDVDVWSGQIDNDHTIVFMTNGCGAWRLTY